MVLRRIAGTLVLLGVGAAGGVLLVTEVVPFRAREKPVPNENGPLGSGGGSESPNSAQGASNDSGSPAENTSSSPSVDPGSAGRAEPWASGGQPWRETIIPCPHVVGRTYAEAAQVARVVDVDLVHGIYFVASTHWQAGLRTDQVALQTPQPGSLIPRGGVLAVWTYERASDAQEIVAAPDLAFLTIEEARAQLKDSGLHLMENTTTGSFADLANSDSGASPRVVEQFPLAGQPVFRQTGVLVRLSREWGDIPANSE